MEEEKRSPILFEIKEECCGCGACFAVCPQSKYDDNCLNAIDMQPDEMGFYYPVINSENCIRCYRCLTVCPLKESLSPH